jgi:predicted Zn finger-like uncharacterized protein
MSLAELATIVIACPDCGTRYQVPVATLGASGREVQCAQCRRAWHADSDAPLPAPVGAPFEVAEEAALDSVFEAAAKAGASPAPEAPLAAGHVQTLGAPRGAVGRGSAGAPDGSVDPAVAKKARRSLDRRLASVSRTLPHARVRRVVRISGLALLLAVLLAGGLLRTEIVRWYPSMAGLYAAIGLPVNVVGLEFEQSRTLSSLRDGKAVLRISARIRSTATRPVAVQPVLVSLLNGAGATIYEWTVTPAVPELAPGEFIEFATEVNAPPDGATLVRLSFTENRGSFAAPPLKAL